MKKLLARKQIFILLIVLALVQFACNLGARASSIATQASQPSAPTSAPQATQPVAATSSTRGTAVEAQAMLKLAVAHYQAVGREQALKDFTNRVPPFFDRDLNVTCMDSHLILTADGRFPGNVGASQDPFNADVRDDASTDTIRSINYSELDTATGITMGKTLFFEKVGMDVCGVGAYQP